MANLNAESKWSSVRLLETHELACGGINGNMNEQAKALAERTEFLNQEKANKSEIIQGVFEFLTFDQFDNFKENLPQHCTVILGEKNTTGLGTWGYGYNIWNGNTLEKSPVDTLEFSRQYIDSQITGQNILEQAELTTDFFINILPNENKIQSPEGFNNISTLIVRCKPDTEYLIKNFTKNYSAFSIHEHFEYTTTIGTVLTASAWVGLSDSTYKLKTGLNARYLYINKTFENFTNNISEICEEVVSLVNVPLITERSIKSEDIEELTYGENTFDVLQVVTGKVIERNVGNIIDFISFRMAVIPVEPNTLLNIYCDDYRSDAFVYGFRSTNDLSIGETFASGNASSITLKNDNSFDVTVPEGMNYLFINVNYFGDPTTWDIRLTLRVSEYVSSKKYITEINKLPIIDKTARELIKNMSSERSPKLYQKRWLVIGDSISDYTYRPYAEYKNYAEQLESKHRMTIYKYGQSGSGFYGRYNSLNQITQSESEVDFITVFLGTNDWGNINGNNKYLGDFGDTSASTICGCISLFIQDLITRFPNTPIFFFTPLPRHDAWGENTVNNSQGYKLNELVEMIKRYAHHYSFPVLDLYNESNFKCQTTVQKNIWTVWGDGVHPTKEAHERLISIIENFLIKNLINI